MTGSGRRRRGETQAVAGLAAGLTFEAAAEQAGIGERTLRRWWTEDAGFRAQVEEVGAVAIVEARRLLLAALPRAAEWLVRLAVAPASVEKLRPSTRLRAVESVLDRALRFQLEQRITRLEEKVGI